MSNEIRQLYAAYIRSSVPHDKIVAGLIREYGEAAVKLALGDTK